MNVIAYAKEHPVPAGLAIVAAFAVLYVLSSKPAPVSDGGAGAAYFAATASQAQSANALEAVRIQSQAQTAQVLIAAETKLADDMIWSNTAITTNQSNNAAAVAALPYQLQNNIVGALGAAAQLPGTTTTKKSGGFLGIGGGTTQTYTPNPVAVSAAQSLSNLLNGSNLTNSSTAGFASVINPSSIYSPH